MVRGSGRSRQQRDEQATNAADSQSPPPGYKSWKDYERQNSAKLAELSQYLDEKDKEQVENAPAIEAATSKRDLQFLINLLERPMTQELIRSNLYVQSIIRDLLTFTDDSAQNDNEMHPQETASSETSTEEAAIQQRALTLMQALKTIDSLGIEGVDIQVRIAAAHELGTRLERMAKNLGMNAIAEGQLSQAQVSRLLKVAPMTVNRWVKTAQEQQDDQEPQDL
jgi:hypothetical protein